MLLNPVIGGLDLTHDPRIAKASHCCVAGCGSGRDSSPTAVLPPRDHIYQSAPIGQSIGVTDQPYSPSRPRDIGDARPQPHVLPAHVRDVMDAPARACQIPIDEGDRSQPRTQIPINRVLRRQVVVANHFFTAGQLRPGREVVKLADQLGDPRRLSSLPTPGG